MRVGGRIQYLVIESAQDQRKKRLTLDVDDIDIFHARGP
jgi:hypothetical protein